MSALQSPPPNRQAVVVARSWRKTFESDFLASIVVVLVALPLCMGIANACGLSPSTGIITGIVGGLIVGFLAGSPLQVSGPAAGMVVVIVNIVQSDALGRPMLGLIVLSAGVLQLIAGALRLGQWFRAVSPAVIAGMLAGIGILIFASQFHVMFDAKPHKKGLDNLLTIPAVVQKALIAKEGTNHQQAALLGVVTLGILIGWKVLMPKKLQLLPAPLVAIVVATVTSMVLKLPIARVEIPTSLFGDVMIPSFANLGRLVETPVLTAIFTVAFVASAETLLCATAVDRLHSGPRTKYDEELAGQGIGNIICGSLGVLPMTGVIVRSTANVEAGSKTRLSTILHGAWLLLLGLFATAMLREVPIAALAAVLVYTGYKLVKIEVIKELWGFGWGEVAIFLCTMIAVVATGLLEGVSLGVILAGIKLLLRFSHLAVRVEVNGPTKQTLHLEGAATFLRLPALAAALEKVPPATELHVHFERLTYIDHACLELLIAWGKQHETLGGSLVIDWDTLQARFNDSPGTTTSTKGHVGAAVSKERH